MCGSGKGVERGFEREKRRLNQAPLSPAAFHALSCKGNVGVIPQGVADLREMRRIGTRIEVDRHAITACSQSLGLFDNSRRVLMAQQDIGYF